MVGQVKSIDDEFRDLNFKETGRDPLVVLPKELVLEIFFHLNLPVNLPALGTLCCVSKQWKQIAKEVCKNVIYRSIAFGNDKWARYFGKEVVDGNIVN